MKPSFLKIFNKTVWAFILLAGLYFLVRSSEVFLGDQEINLTRDLKKNFHYFIQEQAVEDILPNLSFPTKTADEAADLTEHLVQQAYRALPLYGYAKGYLLFETEQESQSTYERILAQEANDENHVDSVTGAVTRPENLDVADQMEEENAAAADIKEGMQTENETVHEETAETDTAEESEESEEEQLLAASVLPVATGISYSMDQLADFDFLLNNFYTVDTSTAISDEVLDAEDIMEKDMTIDTEGEGPQILIYHTHSQEGFTDSVPGDLNTTIVGVGAYLAELLHDIYGYEVLHVDEVFDMVDGAEDRNNAYTLAEKRITQLLSENPTIQVVIDLHRDGVDEDRRLVTTVNGKETAQFMFFNGLSYSKKNGAISYLPNPYVADNLALTLQLQLKAAEYYPGVARKIYLKTYRYNMHLCPKTILVECGAQTNTLQEEKNAMEPLASVLHMVLTGQ